MSDAELLALADQLGVPHPGFVTPGLASELVRLWDAQMSETVAELVATGARLRRQAAYPPVL